MKLSKTSWMVLGIGIFAIAAFSLFQSYQRGVEERDKVENSLSEAQAALSTAIAEKGSAELELTQTEEELQEMQNELSQLETELTQAELTLDRAEAKFPGSVESIEYDELLFSLAADANLKIMSLSTSEAAETDINGIAYATTTFTMNVQGEVADILDFINRIVAEEDLNTAVLEPVAITVPEPLTETEKEKIKEKVAAAEIDRLITEAIEGLAEQERLTQEDIDKIVMELGALIEELKGLTAEELAELTASEIEEQEKASATINLVVYSYEEE